MKEIKGVLAFQAKGTLEGSALALPVDRPACHGCWIPWLLRGVAGKHRCLSEDVKRDF